MPNDEDKPRTLDNPRLELTMRDTLENLGELALAAGYGAGLDGMHILEVIPPEEYRPDAPPSPPEEPDNILPHPAAARVSGED